MPEHEHVCDITAIPQKHMWTFIQLLHLPIPYAFGQQVLCISGYSKTF